MTAKIKLNAASGGGSVSLEAPTSTTGNANVEVKLPVADGSSGQALTTNASGQLAFATVSTAIQTTSGTDNFTVADGNLVIGTDGHGIDFSDSSHASGMTNELLDDYEEGSWTPAIGAGSTTIYGARYTKIGNLCTLSFSAYGFSDNSSSTALHFSGLPFVSSNESDSLNVGVCFTAKFNVAANVVSYIAQNRSIIDFYDHAATDYDHVRHNHIQGTDTTHRIFTTITYRTP